MCEDIKPYTPNKCKKTIPLTKRLIFVEEQQNFINVIFNKKKKKKKK